MSVLHVDQNALMTLKNLMEGEFASLLTMFLQDSEMNIQRIEHGLKAKNKDSIRSAAHAIKGSAANVGTVYLSKLAAELENQIKLDQGDFDTYNELLQHIYEEFYFVKKALMLEAVA